MISTTRLVYLGNLKQRPRYALVSLPNRNEGRALLAKKKQEMLKDYFSMTFYDYFKSHISYGRFQICQLNTEKCISGGQNNFEAARFTK